MIARVWRGATRAEDERASAVFFPEDDRLLVECELGVAHYDVDYAP